MKKFLMLMLMITFCFSSFLFVACGEKYKNVSIDVDEAFEIVLGQNENNLLSVVVEVVNGDNNNGLKLGFSPDREKMVEISQEYIGNNKTKVNLKALAPGNVKIEVRTLEGGITKSFDVKIIQPITDFNFSSQDKFAIVRGTTAHMDFESLLNFYPGNTNQKRFSTELKFDSAKPLSYYAGIDLEDNAITVDSTSRASSFSVAVSSLDNPLISPKICEIEIVEPITLASDEDESFTSGEVVLFNDAVELQRISELSLIGNDTTESQKTVLLRVFSSRGVDVVPVYSLENMNVLLTNKYDAGLDTEGNKEYTDFIYSVRYTSSQVANTNESIQFNVSYLDISFISAEQSTQLAFDFAIKYDYTPETIYVNNQTEDFNFNIYNHYSTAQKGHKLVFDVIPASVSYSKSGLFLRNANEIGDAFDSIEFYRSTLQGLEMVAPEEGIFMSGETLYCKAKTTNTFGTFKVDVISEYDNTIYKSMTFNVLSGIQAIGFVGDAADTSLNMQLNSDANNKAILLLQISPKNIDIKRLDVSTNGNVTVESVELRGESETSITVAINLVAESCGVDQIRIITENGFELTKDIRIIESVVSYAIDSQSVYESTYVGRKTLNNGSLSQLSVALQGAVPLYFNVAPNNALYTVDYQFAKLDTVPNVGLEQFVYSNYSDDIPLDYEQLVVYNNVVVFEDCILAVKVNLLPKVVSENNIIDGDPIEKYFVIRGYTPIKYIALSKNSSNLIPYSLVGEFKKENSKDQISLTVYPANATFAEDYYWSYDTSSDIFSFDETTGLIDLWQYSSQSQTISVKINEFDRTFEATYKINIEQVEQVDRIVLANVGDEIYLENSSSEDITYRIVSSAYPQEAFNKNLKYSLLDQNKQAVSPFSIHADGTMVIPSGIGFVGYLVVAAEDCYLNAAGNIQPNGRLGYNILQVPITIANGLTKDTAFRIYGADQLKNISLDRHYVITNNFVFAHHTFEGEFVGGLYGTIGDVTHTLSGITEPLFQTIGSEGVIEGINFSASIDLSGETAPEQIALLANDNVGNILNVQTNGTIKGKTVAGLVVNNNGLINNAQLNTKIIAPVGTGVGVALVNNGDMYDIRVMGSIDAANAFGFVKTNNLDKTTSPIGLGIIENARVLLVNENSIKGSTVATGFCEDNYGEIYKSYVYSYGSSAIINSPEMFGFAKKNSGQIRECFVALSQSTEFFFVGTNIADGEIDLNELDGDDVLIATYDAFIANCYSTSKFVEIDDYIAPVDMPRSHRAKIETSYCVAADAVLGLFTGEYGCFQDGGEDAGVFKQDSWDYESANWNFDFIWTKLESAGAYPYLQRVVAEVAPKNITISTKISTKDMLQLTDTHVALFYYVQDGGVLSSAEKAKLIELNTLSIADLINISVDNGASNNISNFKFSIVPNVSTEGSLEIIGSNIILKNTTNGAKVRIESIYDSNVFAELTISVIYPILNFNVYYGSGSVNDSILPNESTLMIKRANAQQIFIATDNTKILVDRKITIKTNNMQVSHAYDMFERQPDNSFLRVTKEEKTGFGVTRLFFDPDLEHIISSFTYNISLSIGGSIELVNAVASNFQTVLNISLYTGAEWIKTDISSAEMEPSDTLVFLTSLKSDFIPSDSTNVFEFCVIDENDKLLSSVTTTNGSTKSVSFEEGLFWFEYDASDYTETVDHFKIFNFTTKIHINRDSYLFKNYFNTTKTFTIQIIASSIISANDIRSTIKLTIKPQTIDYILTSHYYADNYDVVDGRVQMEVSFEPTNTLAPGKEGLLEINTFPSYANIDRVEIISSATNDFKASLRLAETVDDKINTYIISSKPITQIPDGISVPASSIENGRLYVITQVGTNILNDTEFVIVVKVYQKNLATPFVQNVNLVVRYIPQAELTIDGKDSAVVGRGTTSKIQIVVYNYEYMVNMQIKNANNGNEAYKKVTISSISDPTVEETQKGVLKYTYSAELYVGVGFERTNADGDDSYFTVEALVSRVINGKEETTTSLIQVWVVDFVVNNISLINNSDKNELNVFINVVTKLDFNIETTIPTRANILISNNIDEERIINEINANIAKFKAQSFIDESTLGSKRIYFVSDDETLTTAQTNDYLEIISNYDDNNQYINTIMRGLIASKLDMRLQLELMLYQGTWLNVKYSPIFDFSVVIKAYTTEEKPLMIYSKEDWDNVFLQDGAYDYILMNDITLDNLIPYADTLKINSLDGNGKMISIKSFNTSGDTGTLSLALFDNISSITTIKNLIVNYSQVGMINIANDSALSSINYAGFAINNDGIVNNCHVLSNSTANVSRGLILSNDLADTIESNVAGFVLTNNGSITNSRVGGTSYEKVVVTDFVGVTVSNNLRTFYLQAKGVVSGFVGSNAGKISACYASNISIVNNVNVGTALSSGFVNSNYSGAQIVGSYVVGVTTNDTQTPSALGEGIETNGIAAGFVYNNNGTIQDCLSNIRMYAYKFNTKIPSALSSGFVYENESNGIITTCASYSDTIDNDSSQAAFSGVDKKLQNLNKGKILYSFYYSTKFVEESYDNGALPITDYSNAETYFGFSFTSSAFEKDGVWMVSSRGLSLVSANDIALSVRQKQETTTTIIQDGKAVLVEDYVLFYVPGYEYGGVGNPIIIRTASEFNKVFSSSVDSNIKAYYDEINKTAFGSYRIINDLDLSELNYATSGVELETSGITLKKYSSTMPALIDGNNMTISAVDISVASSDSESFGLFKALRDGAVVKNLNMKVTDVSASTISYVGSLAGVCVDSKIMNINVMSNSSTIAEVKGKNLVGGVVGYVYGSSRVYNVSSKVSATASYKSDNTSSFVAEQKATHYNVGYAGGAIGAANILYEDESYDFSVSSMESPQIRGLVVSDNVKINAKIAGGVIGYIGKTTFVEDVQFVVNGMTNLESLQLIIAQNKGFAGGIVGECAGKLASARLEAITKIGTSDTLQEQIEDGILSYYSTSKNSVTRLSNDKIFSSIYSPRAIGGIAGIVDGGYILTSFAKVDVENAGAKYVGGIVGQTSANGGSFSQVYCFGSVAGKANDNLISMADDPATGTAIGFVCGDTTFSTVNTITYYKKSAIVGTPVVLKNFYGILGEGANIQISNSYVVGKLGNILTNSAAITADGLTRIDILSLVPPEDSTLSIKKVFNITKGAWDIMLWARKDDSIFPHLTFGREANIFYINNESATSDFAQIIANPNKNFIINDMVDMSGSVADFINSSSFRSVVFKGMLMGLNEDCGLENMSYTLFNSASGATFRGFTIKNSDLKYRANNYGLLANTLYSSEVSSLTFENCTVSRPDSNDNDTIGESQNIGMLAARLSKDSLISNVLFDECEITTDRMTTGFLAGIISQTNMFSDIYVNKSTITHIGSPLKETDPSSLSFPEIYVGLYVGRAAGTTEISCIGSSNSVSMISKSLIAFTGSISENLCYDKIRAGLLVGYAVNLSVSGSTNATIDGDIRVLNNTVIPCAFFGGVAGEVADGTITQLNIQCDIYACLGDVDSEVSNDLYSAVGGAFGTAGNCGFENVKVKNGTKENNESEENKKIDGKGLILVGKYVYVGGLVGYITSSLISDIQTDPDSNITSTSISEIDIDCKKTSDNINNIYAGGALGFNMSKATIDINRFILKGNISVVGKTVYVGGVVAYENSSTSNKVKNAIILGCINVDAITAYVGGVVGKSMKSTIDSCVITGDITIANNNQMSSLVAGGIVGVNSGTVKNNVSISSIKNNNKVTIKSDEKVSEVIGAIAGQFGSQKAAEYTNNLYSHQLSLYVDDATKATNVYYYRDENSLYSKAKALVPETYISEFSINRLRPFVINNKSKVANDNGMISVSDGSCYVLTSDVEELYFDIDDDVNGTFIGDGYTVTNSAGDSNTQSLFSKINRDSIVSGFIVCVNDSITVDKVERERKTAVSVSYSPLTSQNYGFISGIASKGYYTIESGSSYSGLVGENNGYITYSNSNVDIITRGAVAVECKIGMFCCENNGMIDYCYSTGSFTGSNAIYLFGNNMDDATMRKCYTISCQDVFNANSHTFGAGILEDCYYDKDANQNVNTDAKGQDITSVSGNSTSLFTLSKITNDKKSIYSQTTLKDKDDNIIALLNYGYLSLSSGAFKEVNYMALNTGFQIPNATVLQNFMQTRNDSSVTWQINRTIDFEHTKSYNNWTPLETQLKAKLNGLNYILKKFEIVNINNAEVGLFQSIDSTVSNIVFDSAKIEMSNTPAIRAGLISAKMAGGKIENCVVKDSIINCSNDDNDYSIVGSLIGEMQANMEDGGLFGCNIIDTIIEVVANYYSIGGGIVGRVLSGNINDCWTTQNTGKEMSLNVSSVAVVSHAYVGGIVGQVESAIINGASKSVNGSVFSSAGPYMRNDRGKFSCAGGIVGAVLQLKMDDKNKLSKTDGYFSLQNYTNNASVFSYCGKAFRITTNSKQAYDAWIDTQYSNKYADYNWAYAGGAIGYLNATLAVDGISHFTNNARIEASGPNMLNYAFEGKGTRDNAQLDYVLFTPWLYAGTWFGEGAAKAYLRSASVTADGVSLEKAYLTFGRYNDWKGVARIGTEVVKYDGWLNNTFFSYGNENYVLANHVCGQGKGLSETSVTDIKRGSEAECVKNVHYYEYCYGGTVYVPYLANSTSRDGYQSWTKSKGNYTVKAWNGEKNAAHNDGATYYRGNGEGTTKLGFLGLFGDIGLADKDDFVNQGNGKVGGGYYATCFALGGTADETCGRFYTKFPTMSTLETLNTIDGKTYVYSRTGTKVLKQINSPFKRIYTPYIVSHKNY